MTVGVRLILESVTALTDRNMAKMDSLGYQMTIFLFAS